MSAEDILSQPQPPPDERIAYGSDPNQFLEARLPRTKGPHSVLLNIHGGFWRAKYDLAHTGHLCEALRAAGVATFNTEYRRIGNPGGGWHSAGGQLALCLAAHETSLHQAISLAGVVDLKKAFALHLSHDAVAEFLGGKPDAVPEHYREADPMELRIPQARQWLLQGSEDDTVPPEFSRDYVMQKKKAGEATELLEIPHAGHFDLIDPTSEAFKQVKNTVLTAV